MNKMIEKFKYEDIAVHCNTQKEYDELMKLLEKYDFRWRSGGKTTCFNAFEVFKSKTYINAGLYNIIPGLGYADKYYYVIKKYELIECKDFIKQVNAEERTSIKAFNSIFKHLCELDTEKEQVENEFEQIEIKQEKTSNGNLINYAVINDQKCRLSLVQYEIIKKINSILEHLNEKDDD
mgnify:CR=1 FL=1